MTEIARLYATVTADTSKLEKSLQGVKADLTSTEKGFASFQKGVNAGFKAIGLAAAAAFAGLTAAVGASIKAATDFEQNVADIGAVMSLTAAETAKLQDHIMDLGLDPNLKVSATEASDAIMSLGTAGLNVTQIMGGASKATVLLANATGGDMANSAALMTDVMAQYGITAEETGRIVDQLTGLTVASKFSFEDAALAFGQVGGVAGSLGLTLEDTSAILGATAYNFNSGSDAATSMKTFLQRLIPTTNDAKEAMIQLGLSTGEDVVTAFFTADGAMRSAEEIAGNLSKAFAGLSDAQRNEAASTIFGTDAMRTALALADGGTATITKFKDEVAKVDAGEMASKRMNTFAGALEIAQGVVETISISIGQKFLPVLRPLVEQFSNLAQTQGPKLIDFFGQFAEKVAALIQQGIDWFRDVLVPMGERFAQIGKAINTVTGIIMQALHPITNTISKWIGWQDIIAAVAVLLGGAVLASIAGFVAALAPVILLVGKVALAIALMRKAWDENFLGIRDVVQSAMNFISKFLIDHTTLWKGSWSKTLKFFTENSRQAWTELKDTVVSKFRDWTREVRHVVETWIDVTERKINNWIVVTGYDFARWRDWGIKYFREFVQWAGESLEKLLSWFIPREWIDKGKHIIQGLWDGVKEKWTAFSAWFKGTWQDLVERFKDFFGIHSPSTLFRSYGSDMMAGLQEGIDAGANMVFDSMDKMTDGIAGKLDAIPGLIDRSNAVVAMEAFQAKLKFLEEASKSIGPYWLQPGYEAPASTMPPVLKNPNPSSNTGSGNTGGAPHKSPLPGWFNKKLSTAIFEQFGDANGGKNFMEQMRIIAQNASHFINSTGSALQGSSETFAALQRLMGDRLGDYSINRIITDAQIVLNEVQRREAADPFGSGGNGMQRNNELLMILIQELRNKNLNVTVNNSSGAGYGELVTHLDGMRR